MMFHLRLANGNAWAVVDEQGKVCFTGTPRDCEQWLDLRENMARLHKTVRPVQKKLRKTMPVPAGGM